MPLLSTPLWLTSVTRSSTPWYRCCLLLLAGHLSPTPYVTCHCVQGCETKDAKVVNLCLQVIQRLITAQVASSRLEERVGDVSVGAGWERSQVCCGDHVDVDGGWTGGGQVAPGEQELEIKFNHLLSPHQTLTLLATTNSVCQGEALARCLVICFRLAFSKVPLGSRTSPGT